MRSKRTSASRATVPHHRFRGSLSRAWVVLASGAALAAGALSMAGATAAHAAPMAHLPAVHAASQPAATGFTGPVDFKRACAMATKPGREACMALIRTNVAHVAQSHLAPNAAPTGVGYGPNSLQAAYKLPSSTNGSGETVAVVDAFDDPTAAADLAQYRSDWGLPPCGSGCFEKVNQNGQTSPLPASAGTTGWDVEESLDIDMVSAACPLCHIILVEASSASTNALGAGVNAAVALGADFVSNSYGGPESTSDNTFDSEFYSHPGVAVTASAGDSGFGVSYPAASSAVVAVGGTSLTTSTNSRGWTESVWGSTAGGEGTGSGCSADSSKPSWQTDTGCARRTDNDVAADADPNTGVAVYDTFSQGGYLEVGGTSASAPFIAAVYALAGTPTAGTNPASYIYSHTSNLFDVTTGADGSCSTAYLCHGETGYDGPTGWGTPNGITAFSQGGGGGGGNTVTVTNPGNQSTATGSAVSLQIHATDSATGQTLTYSATGLPTGLSINSSTGLISGTASTAGTFSVTVKATDTTGASGSASFTWTVSTAGGCTSSQLLGNPGFETGSAAPWTSTAGVVNPNGAGEISHSGSWYAWLDGYGTTHTDTLAQTVTIPAACSHSTFSFWLHIDTSETTTTTAFDKLTVTENGTTIATFSNLNHHSGYTQHSFSLAGITGSVTIKFSGTEDISLQTSFVIDDTALTTG
ncbi:MAG TPA: putative Ig domain-containing protein [Streptosporangiaceae bacterium]|nr:putative Ig domain-containing protein [Streptosporangiaceae bacterium]